MQIVFYVESGRCVAPQVWLRPNSAALDIIHASMASVLVCTNFQVTGYRLQVTVSPWIRFALSTVKHKETRTQGAGFCFMNALSCNRHLVVFALC